MIAAKLHDRHGVEVAAIEVPNVPSLPGIVKWGATYYANREDRDGFLTPKYDEAWCYAVPISGTVST